MHAWRQRGEPSLDGRRGHGGRSRGRYTRERRVHAERDEAFFQAALGDLPQPSLHNAEHAVSAGGRAGRVGGGGGHLLSSRQVKPHQLVTVRRALLQQRLH